MHIEMLVMLANMPKQPSGSAPVAQPEPEQPPSVDLPLAIPDGEFNSDDF